MSSKNNNIYKAPFIIITMHNLAKRVALGALGITLFYSTGCANQPQTESQEQRMQKLQVAIANEKSEINYKTGKYSIYENLEEFSGIKPTLPKQQYKGSSVSFWIEGSRPNFHCTAEQSIARADAKDAERGVRNDSIDICIDEATGKMVLANIKQYIQNNSKQP
jgi:hypothetical protein